VHILHVGMSLEQSTKARSFNATVGSTVSST